MKISDNAKFCTYCGASLGAVRKQLFESPFDQTQGENANSPELPGPTDTTQTLQTRQTTVTKKSIRSKSHDKQKSLSRRTALLVVGSLGSLGALAFVSVRKGILKWPFVSQKSPASSTTDNKAVKIETISRPTFLRSLTFNQARWASPALWRYTDETELEKSVELIVLSETSSDGSDGTYDLEDSVATAADTNPEGDPSDTKNPYGTIASYTINSDFSNVTNIDDIDLFDEEKNLLIQNGFAVSVASHLSGYEYYSKYESNRYFYIPSFVTIDSMMHTYHLYFSYLQKNTEKNFLVTELELMSDALLNESISQLDTFKGSEWESAAKRNVVYFGVACVLLGLTVDIPDSVLASVDMEVANIDDATTVTASSVVGDKVDYTQFIVRGYYEGDSVLEAYFRVMMWYGLINFKQNNEDLDRSAALMTLAIYNAAFDKWKTIYMISSFFAGESDDNGFYEYYPVITAIYGDSVSAKDLVDNDAAWEKYHKATGEMEQPKIATSIVGDDSDKDDYEQERGFRLMGQRFSLDARIFSELTYGRVKENSDGNKRTLPNALDVPATLGSDVAKAILDEEGETDYPNYDEQMESLRSEIANAAVSIWTESLYSQWLYTLNPLLMSKGEGYPKFMQSEAWDRKNLQSYLVSFTELKHDTVLYVKQAALESSAEIVEHDDRGYVEPEPEVFSRLASLTHTTSKGLQGYNVINDEDISDLEILTELCKQFATISKKELAGEGLSDDEYEIIRSYGTQLEYFWEHTRKETGDEGQYLVQDNSIALVTDVFTDMSSDSVLELASGYLSTITVIFPINGELHVGVGVVPSFYQFLQPQSERLTDSEWRNMLSNSYWSDTSSSDLPSIEEWTNDFQYIPDL